MATLANLTAAQLKSLNDFDLQLRAAVVELHRAIRLGRAAAAQYNATILPIVSSLDGTELLPTSNGLAGAVPLAESDPGYLISYLSAAVSNYDTNLSDSAHMALYTKAAGAINLVGQ